MSQIYEQPTSGVNMTFTINFELQEDLERELDIAISEYKPDQALGIAMDPDTGEILAIASRPDFSPSDYKNYTVEEINRNLLIWMTYEPGSTFKIITLAAALEETIVDLEKDRNIKRQWLEYQTKNSYAKGISYEDTINSIKIVIDILEKELTLV